MSDLVITVLEGAVFAITPFVSALIVAFLFKVFAREEFPSWMGILIGMAFVGFDAGVLGLAEAASLLTGFKIIFAMVLAAWGVRFGNKMAERFSKHQFKQDGYRLLKRSLYKVKGQNFIEITMPPYSDIENIYGKKPVSHDLKKEIGGKKFVLPADLPVEILEARIKRRLLNDWRVGDAIIKMDESGHVVKLAVSAKKTRISSIIPKDKVLLSFKPESIPFELGYGDMIDIVAEGLTVKKVEVLNVSEGVVSVILDPEDAGKIAKKVSGGVRPSVVVFPHVKESEKPIKEKDIENLKEAPDS